MGEAEDLRGVFGWSLPFRPDLLSDELLDLMRRADLLDARSWRFRSRARVSSLQDGLFLHSAFPTVADDAVFFGPDTYRFARFLAAELERVTPPRCVVEIGCGSGAGGILAARRLKPGRLVLGDVNRRALEFAHANARAAGVEAELVEGPGLQAVEGAPDLILANPPFIADDGPAYRAGGGMHGARLSLDWTMEAADRLEPGGRLLLYTGSAVVDGRDEFRRSLERTLRSPVFDLTYEEIDPDIFGDQLTDQAYRDVERIAAVGLRLIRRS
jgi:methylase of polypeptide subunit release factors